ncbi:MAG: ATP-grasp domain-containing protein [Thermomicrobiales bacterium]
MKTAIGVLCTRVRVEEKGIIAALAEAGVPAIPFPPSVLVLVPGPEPSSPTGAVRGPDGAPFHVVIDRCPNRVLAAAVLPLWRAMGVAMLDAGLAASGTRAAVAAALGTAGLPRPETRLVCGEDAALAAASQLGYPATLLPMTPGDAPVMLWDHDTAEAVTEHRATLGAIHDSVVLLQAGAPADADRTRLLVLDGRAIAADAAVCVDGLERKLAEATALALGASLIGVEIARGPAGPVVWDVQPVPEFRGMSSFMDQPIEAMIGRRASERLPRHGSFNAVVQLEIAASGRSQEVANGISVAV